MQVKTDALNENQDFVIVVRSTKYINDNAMQYNAIKKFLQNPINKQRNFQKPFYIVVSK